MNESGIHVAELVAILLQFVGIAVAAGMSKSDIKWLKESVSELRDDVKNLMLRERR